MCSNKLTAIHSTPIYLACEHNNEEIANAILEERPPFSSYGKHGGSSSPLRDRYFDEAEEDDDDDLLVHLSVERHRRRRMRRRRMRFNARQRSRRNANEENDEGDNASEATAKQRRSFAWIFLLCVCTATHIFERFRCPTRRCRLGPFQQVRKDATLCRVREWASSACTDCY